MALTQEQKSFIEKVGKLAVADTLKSNVLASLTIAQAILESGWGESSLTINANALFGIKATNTWKGKVYNTKTKECYNGITFTTIDACFRAYDSWEESIADHSAFLTASRYAAVIGERDYKKACTAIKAAGYATDPDYSAKLIKIIEQYGLTQYDAAQAEKGNKMNIIQDFIPSGRKNRPGKANPMKYITIHNTGNTSKGAGAKNHATYVKGDAAANEPKSWHYTVDESCGYQHLPDNETAYHAGDGASGTGNTQSIGIEICMNSDGDILKATDNAAELTASLCKKHNIPVGNVKQHYDWTKKNCPQMIRSGKPYNWDAFINKVKGFMGISTAAASTPAPATPPAAFTPYTVKITADTLNIRKGAGTNYTTNGVIKDKGIYTIVEEATGTGATKWGRLKSGAGWISLDYTMKV